MSSPLDPPEGTKRGLARNGARIIKKALDDAEAKQKDYPSVPSTFVSVGKVFANEPRSAVTSSALKRFEVPFLGKFDRIAAPNGGW